MLPFAKAIRCLAASVCSLLAGAGQTHALGCSANARSELHDGYYQCRDKAPQSAAVVEVHASTLNPVQVRSTVELQAMCNAVSGAVVACAVAASPKSVCAATSTGTLKFTAQAGTCSFSVSTPGARVEPIVYQHRITSLKISSK